MHPILIGSSRHASGVARTLRREIASLDVACTLSQSQEAVARMFGHRDWHAMVAASEGREASPADDGVEHAEALARRERQVATLVERFSLPAAAAGRVVDAVRPTGRRKERAPTAPTAYPCLDALLSERARMHVFLSGGGLRVVRFERGKDLRAYGEAPNLSGALALAEADARAGGRPYCEVYGKEVPHYLTGAGSDGDPADEWVLAGHCIDAHRKGGVVVVEMKGMGTYGATAEVMDEVLRTGAPVEWSARGMRYRARPGQWAGFVSSECVDRGDGTRDPYWMDFVRRGQAGDLAAAMLAAIAAEEVEEPKGR